MKKILTLSFFEASLQKGHKKQARQTNQIAIKEKIEKEQGRNAFKKTNVIDEKCVIKNKRKFYTIYNFECANKVYRQLPSCLCRSPNVT